MSSINSGLNLPSRFRASSSRFCSGVSSIGAGGGGSVLFKSAIVLFLSFGQRSFILCAAHFGYDFSLVIDDELLQAAIEPAEVYFAFCWPSLRRFDRRQHLIKHGDHHGRERGI